MGFKSAMNKKNFCRNFLVLTISNRHDQYQLGPSERNWQQTPFIGVDDLCADYSDCTVLEMRRWRSARPTGATHRFADLTFLTVNCSAEDGKMAFLGNSRDNTPTEDWQNFEKGLYEELQSVEWEGPVPEESDQWSTDSDGGGSSNWGDYPIGDEEERRKSAGYLLIGHQVGHPFCRSQLPQFATNWHNWCALRDLSDSLPPICTFRRISFFRQCTGKCRYGFVLLIEMDNAMKQLRSISNCINNAQSLCANRAHIELYQEIEFEVDLEVLQKFVAVGKSINCVGRRLVVQFDNANNNDNNNTGNPQNRSPFSLYRENNFFATVGTSPSVDSFSANLNLINNNNPSDGTMLITRSETKSEFDAEMEDIMDENENKPCKTNNNLTNNNNVAKMVNNGNIEEGIIVRDKDLRNRKSSWNYAKQLFTASMSRMSNKSNKSK